MENEFSQIEMGASWIHGTDNEFFDLAKGCGQVHEEQSWEAEGMDGSIVKSHINLCVT